MKRGLNVAMRAVLGGARVSRFALAVSLATAVPAFADETVGTLRGHVEGAASGTVITATDLGTGHRMTATTNDKGDYTLLGLRPSRYRVETSNRKAQEVTLLVGQTVIVDFSVKGDEILVTGRRTRTELVTQTLATSVTTAQIENLPQNARNFLSFASLAPGISLANPSGAQQIQAGAVSPDQTNVYIDGISFKNLTNHGGQFGQNFGQGGNPFPQIAIQEYQIETQNFGAEVSDAGSAVITAITKTGGNSYHGDAFVDYQPNAFIEQPYFDRINHRPKPEYKRYQFGGDISGPIIPDKLTFYFGAEGQIQNLPGATSLLDKTLDPALGYPANVVSSIVGVPHSFDFHQGLYFGKLTLYATSQDTFNLSTFIRRETNLSDIPGNGAPTTARSIQTQEAQYQLNWKHTAGPLLNILNFVYNVSSQATPTVGDGPQYVLTNPSMSTPFTFQAAAILGASNFTQADRQETFTIKDDATINSGNHKIKLGAQVISSVLSRTVANNFFGTYFYNNPGAAVANFDPLTAVPYGADINLQPSATYRANDDQFGFYAQDEWRVGSHFVFNYGLRWDIDTNANNNDYVTPAAIVAGLANYPNLAAAGIDYHNFVSNGSNRGIEYGKIQPRLGFSYDMKGDRDLIIFGGAGRYFDRSLFIEGAIETLTNSSFQRRVNFAPGYTGPCTPAACAFTPALLNPATLRSALQPDGGSIWLLNNNTPAPYSDQFDLGVRKRLGGLQTSLTLSYVRSHNLFGFVRGNRLPNGTYTSAGDTFIEDNFPPAGQVPGFNGKLNLGESAGRADLFAIYVKVEKPFTEVSRWGIVSSLTVQRARTNDSTPSIFNNDENYNGASQTAYGWGYVAGVPWWIWNTSANYRAPYGFQLSGTLNLNSGPAFGNVNFAGTPNGTPIPPGACCYANFNGVYYPKPFVGFKRLDLRIQKTFKMPFNHDHELTLSFEGFNVFNWLNRTYSAWGAGSGPHPTLVEDGQVGNDQREFQAGLRYKF